MQLMFGTLQSCRAFAALIVMLFHLGGTIALDKYFGVEWASRPFAFGHAGVDFFFVLSGFIIVHVHSGDFGHPARIWNYLHKRLLRIYPVYWLVFIGVYFGAFAFPSLRESMPVDAWVLLKSLLLFPQDKALVGGTGAPVLVVAWSLQYEVLFYAIVALWILARSVGIATIVALVVLWVLHPFGNAFPFSFVQAVWLTLFALGAGVAMLHKQAPDLLRAPLYVVILGFLLFIGNGLIETIHLDLPVELGEGGRFIYGIASALMILGLIQAESAGMANRFKPRWAMRLGDASYALYLIHFPLISVICKIAVWLGLSDDWGALATFGAGSILCIAAALLFHSWIEKPMLDFFRRDLRFVRSLA